jgi:F-type H+-transporting ATPase subunit epsilon
MSTKEFKLDIITPRKVVYSGPVVSFSAPGVMGGFQVLYNHAPMLAAIGVGEVKCMEPSGHELRFATSGGFVDVLDNRVLLLAESAEPPAEIDVPRAEAARERARKELGTAPSPAEAEETREALERAMNRIRIARKG